MLPIWWVVAFTIMILWVVQAGSEVYLEIYIAYALWDGPVSCRILSTIVFMVSYHSHLPASMQNSHVTSYSIPRIFVYADHFTLINHCVVLIAMPLMMHLFFYGVVLLFLQIPVVWHLWNSRSWGLWCFQLAGNQVAICASLWRMKHFFLASSWILTIDKFGCSSCVYSYQCIGPCVEADRAESRLLFLGFTYNYGRHGSPGPLNSVVSVPMQLSARHDHGLPFTQGIISVKSLSTIEACLNV